MANGALGDDGGSSATVAVLAPLFPPAFRGGGTIRAVEALVSACPDEIHPVILAGATDLGQKDPLAIPIHKWVELPKGEVFYSEIRSVRAWTTAMRELRGRSPAILYFNSFFNRPFSMFPMLLWRFGYWRAAVPVLAPRGEFGDAALRKRSGRKRLYMWAFRLLGLHRAVIWHSTAAHETRDIHRHWGPHVNVIERESEAVLPRVTLPPTPISGPLRVIFVGRLTGHKGLHIAILAMHGVTSPVVFDVFGPEEDAAYAARCRVLAERVPRHVTVNFHGAADHDEIMKAYRRSEVAIFPTAGENFGHVFAEALLSSCLVLSSPHSPWCPLLEDGGGQVIPREKVSEWRDAIDRIAALREDQRLALRVRAGEVYESWVNKVPKEHIWRLVLDQLHEGQPLTSAWRGL